MSWVNLNDVYVNQTGGTIAGNLSVNGALTVNDGKGTNTTYNVANEITTLRNSVSQNKYPKVICGSVVRNASGFNAVMMFSPEQFKEIAGRAFNNGKDCISVINADGNASGVVVTGVIYDPNTKHLDAHLSGTTGAIRLNYIIALGA